MPTGSHRPTTRTSARSGAGRRPVRRGVVLLAGAAVLLVAVQPLGPLPFGWLPVLAGATFLLAAAVTGPRGPFWTAGLVVTGFGLGEVLRVALGGSAPEAGALPLLLLGAGALAAAWLGSRGFATGTADVGRAVLFIGAGQLLRITTGDAVTAVLAVLLAGWGLWEVFSPAASRGGGGARRG